MTTTSTTINTQRGTLAALRTLHPKRPLSYREAVSVAELQAARLRELLAQNDDAYFETDAITDLPRITARHDQIIDEASGLTVWDGSNWVIVINTTDTKTRQRFSLCHEFKHIVDHATKDTQARFTPEQIERLCDIFAASVLMPKLHVKRYWGRGPRTVSTMAARFGVSPQAMSYRLDQLGLTEPRPRCGRQQARTTWNKPQRQGATA